VQAAPPAAEDPGPVSDAEAVLQAVYEPVNGGYTPEHAYLAASGDLPPEQRPADVAAAQEAVVRILESSDEAGGPLPRAVAAPEVTPEAIAAVVARARELVSAGRVGSFVVVVPEPELARAAELLQRELDAGPDIDVELWHRSIDLLESWKPKALAVTHFGTFHDAEEHLRTLRVNLDEIAEMARGVDAQTFEARMRERMEATGNTESYFAAMPPDTLYAGLSRYFEKRDTAQTT